MYTYVYARLCVYIYTHYVYLCYIIDDIVWLHSILQLDIVLVYIYIYICIYISLSLSPYIYIYICMYIYIYISYTMYYMIVHHLILCIASARPPPARGTASGGPVGVTWYEMIFGIMRWYEVIWGDMAWYDMSVIWGDMTWYDMSVGRSCGGDVIRWKEQLLQLLSNTYS